MCTEHNSNLPKKHWGSILENGPIPCSLTNANDKSTFRLHWSSLMASMFDPMRYSGPTSSGRRRKGRCCMQRGTRDPT